LPVEATRRIRGTQQRILTGGKSSEQHREARDLRQGAAQLLRNRTRPGPSMRRNKGIDRTER
jgi:hypothetical protein